MPSFKYKIKPTRDGKFDVYQDGDWLETCDTREDAEKVIEDRRQFDRRDFNAKSE